MKKILFVCHGNICRSPMAEYIMKDLVRQGQLDGSFYIESAATSTEELGNPVYPPAQRELADHGISCKGHRARQVRADDYGRFDLILCMDQWNLRNISRIIPADPENKIQLLMDYSSRPATEVADPWYTGNFKRTWDDCLEACQGLLAQLTE